MSLPAILWAMYEAPTPTSPTEKCVLMVLAEHANPSGANAFPSWERIAKTVGVSTRTIGSTLSSLQAKGLIRRGDQRIAEAALRGRGKSRAYAPTVWDLVMDGSHAAATQAQLPPAVDEDREATASRRGQRANVQVSGPAGSAGSADLTPYGSGSADTTTIPAAQEPCRSCRSLSECSEACNLTSVRHEVSGRSGVKPASDEPSTSAPNENPPPTPPEAIDQPTANARRLGIVQPRQQTDPSCRPAEELVDAIVRTLPPLLVKQINRRALAVRCSSLADGGWTPAEVARAVVEKSWHGARGGAVMAWLSDLARETARSELAVGVKQSAKPQIAVELRLARDSAAAANSQARRQAVALAAAASSRARLRRQISTFDGKPRG